MSRPYEHHFLPPVGLVPRDAAWVVDVGCNEGWSSAVMAGEWPAANVLGIELDPDVAAKALARFDAHSRVTVVNAAVGWPPRFETAWVHESSTHTSLYKPGGQQLEVRVRDLDEVINEWCGSTEELDYVELDIEGAELEVLSGPCLWAARTRVVAVECHGASENPDGVPTVTDHVPGACEVERVLEMLGFELVEGSFPFMVTGVAR